MKKIISFTLLVLALLSTGCTQEQQNQMSRGIQNWTGTNGVMDVYAGEKLVTRFIKVDKMTTGVGRSDGQQRAYRYSYGFLDENQNYKVDEGEKKVYFEVSDYTNYIFYENPHF
ncbi:MAG: hypothetical protein PF439_08320 [Helicobacteraceae bacterium]|jgi:hypothetical protein|nr:hypothetical protein [Helicobacteraceae bacterium]